MIGVSGMGNGESLRFIVDVEFNYYCFWSGIDKIIV